MRKFRAFESLFFLCVCPWITSGLRADWKDFIDPEILQKHLGKPHAYFNNSFFQGDIDKVDISDDDVNEMAANALEDPNTKWPSNTVSYMISSGFEDDHTRFIMKAMTDLNEKTSGCVKFVERTSEEDYVKFSRGLGCYSAVGRQGGEQHISLTRGCLEELGDTQHELMHALGFYHEISRADRDDYVTINWDNIQEGQARQFQTMKGTTYQLPYDYDSIMQYPFNAFAKDPDLPTIIPTKKGVHMGQNKGPSVLDIQRIRKHYGCQSSRASAEEGTGNQPDQQDAPITTKTKPPTHRSRHKNCKSLGTQNCLVDEPSCKQGFLNVTCDENADGSTIKEVLNKISHSPALPIFLTFNGQTIDQTTFDPVKNNLMGLFISGDTTSWKGLDLPNLVHLAIIEATDLELNGEDLSGFRNLKVIEFDKTTFKSIENNAFAKLPQLQLVALEKGMSFPLASDYIQSVKMLHCQCDYYSWLKSLMFTFKSPKSEGELYNFGHVKSPAFQFSDLFVPVDCLKSTLQGMPQQILFSINHHCSKMRARHF